MRSMSSQRWSGQTGSQLNRMRIRIHILSLAFISCHTRPRQQWRSRVHIVKFTINSEFQRQLGCEYREILPHIKCDYMSPDSVAGGRVGFIDFISTPMHSHFTSGEYNTMLYPFHPMLPAVRYRPSRKFKTKKKQTFSFYVISIGNPIQFHDFSHHIN